MKTIPALLVLALFGFAHSASAQLNQVMPATASVGSQGAETNAQTSAQINAGIAPNAYQAHLAASQAQRAATQAQREADQFQKRKDQVLPTIDSQITDTQNRMDILQAKKSCYGTAATTRDLSICDASEQEKLAAARLKNLQAQK